MHRKNFKNFMNNIHLNLDQRQIQMLFNKYLFDFVIIY
jgi:hypothetical protein